MKFVFNYPETSGLESDLLDSGEISDVAVAVEAAGFDAFALTEHPIPGANWLAHGGHQTPRPVRRRSRSRRRSPSGSGCSPTCRWRRTATRSCSRRPRPRSTAARMAGSSSGSAPATTRPSSSPSASTSTSATRCSTKRSRCCRRRWTGEPFDADGLHFTAKGVIQRPRPAQDPIPIWIGGNSKLSRRRAAAAQGWMPMGIPEEVARTTRSPHISGLEQLDRDDRRGEGLRR